MTKKEKMRLYIAVVLSVVAIVSSYAAISCGAAVIFAEPVGGNVPLPGGEIFALAVFYLTETLVAVFAASASALAAFFTFFLKKQLKNGKKTVFFILFCVLSFLTALDLAVAVIMCF